MNNWRLLLLAVVVVVQPIGSFTESNLINGRECCERSEDARLHEYRKTEERRSLDENREDRRINNEQRRLTLDRIRERRYETIRGPILTRSESLERSERRITPELSRSTEHRLIREQERRHRDTYSPNREAREDLNRKLRESRNILDKNERDSHTSGSRYNLEATRSLSRNAKETASVERESRNSVSRLPIRNSRSIEERRVSPNRETVIIKRKLKDITRSDTGRDSRFSTTDGKIQLSENRGRRVFERRTTEDGIEFRRPRFSDTRIDAEDREVREQKSVEQNARNNRDSTEVRMGLLRSRQRDMEMRGRVSAVRRDSMISTDRMRRESEDENTRLDQNRMDTRDHKRINKQRPLRHESRRTIDSLRIMSERRLDSRETRSLRNAEQMERRPVSMDRLLMLRETRDSRLLHASERNTRDERVARIRDVRNENSDERKPELLSRDRTNDPRHASRKTTSRNDIREYSEEPRQQRKVRDDFERRQESRKIDTRNNAKESSEDRRQQREFRQLSAMRGAPDTQRIRRVSSEGRLQRENNQLSKDSLQEVRGNTERDSRRSTRASSEFRQDRDSNRLSSRRDARGNERSDLRRQVLERSMERARMARSTSAERNDVHETTKASLSVETITRENTRTNQRDERRDHDIEKHNMAITAPQQLGNRRSFQTEIFRVERVVRNRDVRRSIQARVERMTVQRETRNAATPLYARRTEIKSQESRAESTPVRVRADIRENERRDMEREERDDDRTWNLSNRRSNERMFAQRRLENRDSPKDSRKVQTNSVEGRNVKNLSERRQEIRDATKEPRNIRGEIRSESVLTGRRQENRESRNVREIRGNDGFDSHRQRDSITNSRGKSLQRESLGITERLTERSQNFAAGTAVRRESRSDIRTHKALAMERMDRRDNRFTNDVKREETRFRNINDMNSRHTLVEDSDKPVLSNWPMVFYTLQGVYLCGLLVQMLTENANKTKKRTFNWWSTPKNLIKID